VLLMIVPDLSAARVFNRIHGFPPPSADSALIEF